MTKKSFKITTAIPDKIIIKKFNNSDYTIEVHKPHDIPQIYTPFEIKTITFKKKIMVIDGLKE